MPFFVYDTYSFLELWDVLYWILFLVLNSYAVLSLPAYFCIFAIILIDYSLKLCKVYLRIVINVFYSDYASPNIPQVYDLDCLFELPKIVLNFYALREWIVSSVFCHFPYFIKAFLVTFLQSYRVVENIERFPIFNYFDRSCENLLNLLRSSKIVEVSTFGTE